jgi:hypothetical protein
MTPEGRGTDRVIPRILIVAVLLAAAAAGWAQKAEATFTSGKVSMKAASGSLGDLEIGDSLTTGDTVITKADGKAELKLLSGSSRIVIKPNSVFTISEKSQGGASQTALQVMAGSVSMKFEKLTEKEPLVGTSAVMAGVRGTEIEVYSGMDGSSLVAVLSGSLWLESEGQGLDLAANEAVEVKAGAAPGPKFAWLGKELDFSDWNARNLSGFLDNPLASVLEVEAQLNKARASMEALIPELAKQKALYDAAYVELKAAVEAKDEAKAAALRKDRVFPLMQVQGTLILDIRFYALSALSMRRYALGGMYMQMKSRHPLEAETGQYGDFMLVYRRILADFESGFVPELTESDI